MKTTKSRIIFFAIVLTYNLLLGLYLKDFLVLSQTLTAVGVARILSADRNALKGYTSHRLYRPGARHLHKCYLLYLLP